MHSRSSNLRCCHPDPQTQSVSLRFLIIVRVSLQFQTGLNLWPMTTCHTHIAVVSIYEAPLRSHLSASLLFSSPPWPNGGASHLRARSAPAPHGTSPRRRVAGPSCVGARPTRRQRAGDTTHTAHGARPRRPATSAQAITEEAVLAPVPISGTVEELLLASRS
jgi:hypothetical protein